MKNNRIIRLILFLLAFALLLPVTAGAAGPLDPNSETSLTIRYKNGETPISGARFNVYYVADRLDYSEFDFAGDFAGYPASLDNMTESAWQSLAVQLSGHVQTEELSPQSTGETDASGMLMFEGLKPGLYLVIGERRTIGEYTYTAEPYLVSLPGLDIETNTWEYSVTSIPKNEQEINPPEPITLNVLKVWDDAGHENARPSEVTVLLLRNGSEFDSVVLSALNDWSHTWIDLDAGCEWSVAEKKVEGYTQSVKVEGNTFIITNKYNEPPVPPVTPPQLPKTGQLWWPVPVLLSMGFSTMIIGLLFKRREGSETH